MKIYSSIKPRCQKCRLIRRHGIIRIICVKAKHKQRQG
jgi:large subunit ribosomal protein L36